MNVQDQEDMALACLRQEEIEYNESLTMQKCDKTFIVRQPQPKALHTDKQKAASITLATILLIRYPYPS